MPALECPQETKAFWWTLWSDKIIFRWHYGFLRKTSSRKFCCRSRIVRCQISSNAKILKAKQKPISIFFKKKKKSCVFECTQKTLQNYDWGRLPCGPEFDEFLMTFDFHDMFMTMITPFPAPLEWLSKAFFIANMNEISTPPPYLLQLLPLWSLKEFSPEYAVIFF